MPIKNWRLNRFDQLEYHTTLQRLRAAGADLNPSAFERPVAPWISLRICPGGSCVKVMPKAAVFMIYVRVLGLAPRVILQDVELTSPAWNLNAYVLDDPKESNSTYEFYRLLDGARLHRNEVVNHHLKTDRVLCHGGVIEGFLLADTFNSVPQECRDRSTMPLCVSIMNEFDAVCEIKTEVPVEQVVARTRPRPSSRSNLFDGAHDANNRLHGSNSGAASSLTPREEKSRVSVHPSTSRLYEGDTHTEQSVSKAGLRSGDPEKFSTHEAPRETESEPLPRLDLGSQREKRGPDKDYESV